MRIGKRALLVFAFAAAIAIGVAACGGGDDTGTSSDSTSGGSTANVSGSVTVWDWAYESFPFYTKAIDKIDANFERDNPGVTIERVGQPLEQYEGLVRAAFTAKEGPDMLVFLPSELGVLQFTQGLEVLNDRITEDMDENLNGWETTTETFTKEGDRYGVPVGLSGQVFYYNKNLFEKAGLPREFEPQSWDEVYEAAEKLKAKGIEPFAAGDKEGFENSIWFSAGWQTENTNEQAIELAKGEIPLTDETTTKAYEPDFTLQEKGLFPADRYTTGQFTETAPKFTKEEAAMIYGFWNTANFWGEFVPEIGDENVGIFFPPGSDYVGYETEHVLSIPSFSKNPEAAWAFIEYEASPEAMQILSDAGANLPNRVGVTLPENAPSQPRQILETVEQGREEGRLAPYAHIMLPGAVSFGPMATEINQALQGRTSLEAAQEAMQETFEKSAG